MPSTPRPWLRPGRRAIRARGARAWGLLAGAAWVLSSRALCAQAPGAPAAATAEASLALTTLEGGAAWMASAAGLLRLTPRLSLGGAGSVLLGPRALVGADRGTQQELRAAWGGLALQVRWARPRHREVWVRILGGAGNAKVNLALLGTPIASDNFGVLVPEVGATLPVAGPLRVGGALGYRAVVGVDDLPGLAPSDLRGPSARVLLTLQRF